MALPFGCDLVCDLRFRVVECRRTENTPTDGTEAKLSTMLRAVSKHLFSVRMLGKTLLGASNLIPYRMRRLPRPTAWSR